MLSARRVWTNKKDPFVAFSECPHLGCGYKWRQHKVLGQVFLCPCHLSIYDASGKCLTDRRRARLTRFPLRCLRRARSKSSIWNSRPVPKLKSGSSDHYATDTVLLN